MKYNFIDDVYGPGFHGYTPNFYFCLLDEAIRHLSSRRSEGNSKRNAEIFKLRYINGLTYKEIGIRVGRADNPKVPVGQNRIMVTLNQCKRLLRHPHFSNYIWPYLNSQHQARS